MFLFLNVKSGKEKETKEINFRPRKTWFWQA